MTTTVSDVNQSRKRRSSSTLLTVQVFVELTDTNDLDLAGYLSNGTGNYEWKQYLMSVMSCLFVMT